MVAMVVGHHPEYRVEVVNDSDALQEKLNSVPDVKFVIGSDPGFVVIHQVWVKNAPDSPLAYQPTE